MFLIIITIVLLIAGLIQSPAKYFTWDLRQMKGGMPHYLGKYSLVIILLKTAVGLFTLRGLFVICQQYLSTIFCTSCSDGLRWIWSTKFWVPFLVMPRASITTGSFHIFHISLFHNFPHFSLGVSTFLKPQFQDLVFRKLLELFERNIFIF